MATYSTSNKSQGNEMGFYNAEQEQAPILKKLADRFTLSDNFHQSFHGGTGANHFMLGTGDAAFWSDGNGNPITPPANQIANPNPKAGTVNQYTADNNFSACADFSQPGVGADRELSRTICPIAAEPNCAAQPLLHAQQHQSGLSCRTARWSGAGNLPPSPVRTIGDSLIEKNISLGLLRRRL